MAKLVKDANQPYCEHCGLTEIGSFYYDDGCTGWCLECYNSIKPTKPAKLDVLREAERLSRIDAHRQRIEDLEG